MRARAARNSAVAGAVLLLCLLTPAQGQYNNLLNALFGATTTPSSPTVISTTTPTATPAATPAATAAAAAASDSSASSATPATPATATPTAVAAAAPAASATAAAPDTPAITPLPRRTPAPTRRATPSPPPPAPIVIDPSKLVPALPADETTLGPAAAPPAGNGAGLSPENTAVDVVLQVSGAGVTPFVIPQQTVLLRAMASVLTTVSLRDLRIVYVTSSASSRRRLLEDEQSLRKLLQDTSGGQLYNVASVTLQANCSSSNAVPSTLTEMRSVVDNNLLSSAIQSYGQPQWGVSLLSVTAVNPNVATATGQTCRKKFGAICLDGTSLSVAAVEVIIAIGALVLVMLIAIPCVLLEWRRKSGQMAELEPTPQTPKSPLDHIQQIYNKLVDGVKAVSPMHKRGASNGRNAFRNETPTSATSEKPRKSSIQLSATT